MTKKNNMIPFIVFLIAVLFFTIYFIPTREELSLLYGSPLLSPVATKIAIERRHAREDYLQTLGPDMKYASYYSTDYYG
jgi:hypothetical protein